MAVIEEGPGWRIEKTDSGVIHAKVMGSTSDDEIFRYMEVWQRVVEENAPCLHLLDAADIELNDLKSRWDLATRMKDNARLFAKSAVIGETGAKRWIGQVVVKTSGRKNVRFFDTAAEAEAWLISDD